MSDETHLRYVNGRLAGMRTVRYSWWVHWRELADYFLPSRYRWLITANQMNRGSPINGHIIDSTGLLAARDCASGLLSGKSSPIRKWFKLGIGHIDDTQTSPTSLWLAECGRLMRKVFQESNFYNSIAQFYYDLVVFNTAVMLIYEDYENVILCQNPCAGEYFIDLDGQGRPNIFAREFTLSVGELVSQFGIENCSESVQRLYKESNGTGLARDVVVGHLIEPNDDSNEYGVDKSFAYRECYWEIGNAQGQQQTPNPAAKFLRRKGYYEKPFIAVRWAVTGNDRYGRGPSMDGLGDNKQLQQQSRRKAQAVDKMVNPPLVADIQLKNQPASLLPGGMTYAAGMAQTGKPPIASIYDTKFPIGDLKEDMEEVRARIRKVFFNDLFMTASQFETRSNITAVEWDMRKSESMVMLGPVLERIDNEGLAPVTDRVFNMMARVGILPPPPAEIAGMNIDISFTSILAQAQEAAAAAGIERTLGMAGNIAGVKPEIIEKIDLEYAIDKYSSMLGNDPKMMRSPQEYAERLRQMAQQQQQAQQAEMVEKYAKSAQNLAGAEVGAGQNALQMITGAA